MAARAVSIRTGQVRRRTGAPRVSRLPIVAVMGSGSDAHSARAQPLGRWLAARGVHLLTGGGGGVMAAVSEAFTTVAGRRGLVIGVIPSAEGSTRPKPGYPNRWVEIALFTHLPLSGVRGTEPLSRNHINVLSADVIVALPGGAGTASEIQLALDYERALVAFIDAPGDIAGLPADTPIVSRFEAVCDFVAARLAALGTRS